MRRYSAVLILGSLLWAATALDGFACGDKFLVLGRGVRFRIKRSDHPASIVLYMRPGSRMPESARRLKLQASLAQAGHRVEEVEDLQQLAAALRKGTDLVMADLSDVPSVTEKAHSAASRADIVPLVDRRHQDMKEAQARYPHAVPVPSSPPSYLRLIETAMKERRASR